MSAYGHQMEREYSSQSLPSEGGSERGSHYIMESGIYMTSFAATIFIAGLVTAGISLLTLLIALTVMLRSCESKSAGVVQMRKFADDYDYCKIYLLHVELNRLETDSFPAMCKGVAIQYIKDGRYVRDLDITMEMAEKYFSTIRPLDDGRDVVLMDLDDFLPTEFDYTYPLLHRFDNHGYSNCKTNARCLKNMFFVKLYMKLRDGGWTLILLSRKPEKLRNATEHYLVSAGCGGWCSLIMRIDDEIQMDSQLFLSRRRYVIEKEGFRIKAIISSQLDAITGPCLGRRVFKIPNSYL